MNLVTAGPALTVSSPIRICRADLAVAVAVITSITRRGGESKADYCCAQPGLT